MLLRIIQVLAICVIFTSCTSEDNKHNTPEQENNTELQTLQIVDNKRPEPGQEFEFYYSLPTKEFNMYNGQQKPDVYAFISWGSTDRTPNQTVLLRFTQKKKNENKFYAKWKVPSSAYFMTVFPTGREEQVGVSVDFYLRNDSIANYLQGRNKLFLTFQNPEFEETFVQMRSTHPSNLESFILLWQKNKPAKESIDGQIDSLAKVFPGHPHLDELRLARNIIFFDSSLAMQKQISQQLDILWQRDSLALLLSPVYKTSLMKLCAPLTTKNGKQLSPFGKYVLDFARITKSPIAISPIANIAGSSRIEPTLCMDIYNSLPTLATDPLLRLMKYTSMVSYMTNGKIGKESLTVAEKELRRIIVDIQREDLFDANICYDPRYLWMIRYWAHQDLAHALKMQGRLNEAIDSLERIRSDYSRIHTRQGHILYELGDIALEQGDTTAFFQYMVQANRINPTFPFPLQDLKAQAEKRGVTDFEEFYRSLSDAIPFETMPLPEGTPATLAGTDATTIQLTGKRQKPLLLFFTTSTCSPCKILYKAMLEEMKNNPSKYDVDICLVFPNNDKGFAGYVQANGGKAKNVYFAESSTLHGVFGVSGVPDVAVINRDGVITGFVRGAGPNDNVVSLLSAAK